MSITFVSCFFNIGRETNVELQKFENYFQWIERLFELDINLYFFTTYEVYLKLKFKSRKNLYIRTLRKIPGNSLDKIRKIWINYQTNFPEKDTAEFAFLTMAKYDFLQMAILDNPFDSEYFAWIDAGLKKVVPGLADIYNIIPTKLIKICLMNYTPLKEAYNLDFVMSCRYKVCGGFFLGGKENILKFVNLMKEEAKKYLDLGYFGMEQEFMAIVYFRNPELFDPYFGDFRDLLCNFDSPNDPEMMWLIIRYFNHAMVYSDIKEAEKCAKYLLKNKDLLDYETIVYLCSFLQ